MAGLYLLLGIGVVFGLDWDRERQREKRRERREAINRAAAQLNGHFHGAIQLPRGCKVIPHPGAKS